MIAVKWVKAQLGDAPAGAAAPGCAQPATALGLRAQPTTQDRPGNAAGRPRLIRQRVVRVVLWFISG